MTTNDFVAGGGPIAIDRRRARPVRRDLELHRRIRDLVGTYTRATYFGENRVLGHVAVNLGLEPDDLVLCDLLLDRRLVTLIVIMGDGRGNPVTMARVMDLRHQAKKLGYRGVLVPEGVVARQPRLRNASLLGQVAARVEVDPTSRMIVLTHLAENGDCSLGELAALLTHPDPFGAVLHLATTGALRVDLRRAISPSTSISLPVPCLLGSD
jgi:hypothetical protein